MQGQRVEAHRKLIGLHKINLVDELSTKIRILKKDQKTIEQNQKTIEHKIEKAKGEMVEAKAKGEMFWETVAKI